jgi:hypothetical protein
MADTHGQYRSLRVPPGDVLVHAGDLTTQGTLSQLADVFGWLVGLPHLYKIVTAGNHDVAFERSPLKARSLVPPGVTYLGGNAVNVEGRLLWGGPWSPLFAGWAFESSAPTMVPARRGGAGRA